MFLSLYFNVANFNSKVSGLFYDAYLESFCVGWGWSDLLKEGFIIPIVEHLLSEVFFNFIKYDFMSLFRAMLPSESSILKFVLMEGF